MLISLSPLFWSAKLRSQNLMSRYEGRSDVEKWIPCRWHHFAGKTHMKRTKLGCVKKLCVSEISTELKKKTEPKSGCGVKGLEQKTGIIKLHQISWFNFITYIFQYTINIHQRGISWNIMEYSPRSTHWLQICKTCSNHLLIGGAGSFLSPCIPVPSPDISCLTNLHVVLSNLQNPAKIMDLNHGVQTWVGLK